ncbi:MAG: hypothetical protein AAGG51_02320 [Cyanobacteria bacterium P01_G01_bin.54]
MALFSFLQNRRQNPAQPMVTDLHIPNALEVDAAPPWYRHPLWMGSVVLSMMVGVSLWSYLANPSWLGESDGSNALIERILELNPGLSRDDLEQDIQLDNLSFWFGRSDQEYTGVPGVGQPSQEGGEGSPLEQFMKSQQSNQDGAINTEEPKALANTENDGSALSDANSPAPAGNGRSALDIALHGADATETQALTPLERALQAYPSQGNASSTATNTASQNGTGLNNQPSIYENNTGLPNAPVAGADVASGRNDNALVEVPTIEPFTPRSRRPSPLPTFDPSAYNNTASPPTNTANPNANFNNGNGRRQPSTNLNNGNGNYNRVGNGEIESFANPLGSSN